MRWNSTTKKPRENRGPAGVRELKALTIACHPDPRRIGERVLLPELDRGQVVRLSRGEPDFAELGSAWGRPLEDPYLSRQPILLEPDGDGGLVLDSTQSPIRVQVGGDVVESPRRLSAQEVSAGIVVELAGRIVIVIHLLPDEDSTLGEPSEPERMAGASAAMTQVRAAVARVAHLEVPVLLRGESGTGKELAARALHRRGRRSAGPFMAVNLAALPPSLAAAELFGSVKGAFTGAGSGQSGYFRSAQGGTLFLDEVAETPAEVQAMLLRALETGEIFPLGSQQAQKVDVRLVAATDADLEARVRDGRFKEPLLHRLAAYEIWLPPLRRRLDDVGRLFLLFAREEFATLGEQSRLEGFNPEAPPWFPAGLAARLLGCPWPGNVRQLRNVVRQLVIDNRGRDQLVAGPRVERLLAASRADEAFESANASETTVPGRRRRPAEVGAAELEAALRAHRFEPAAAAGALGITRPSLYYLIRQHPTLKTAEDLDDATIRQALDQHPNDIAAAARELEVSARALRRRLNK